MKVIVAYSGGKDSQASLLWAVEKYGRKNVESVFCDTGWEHPATYQQIIDTVADLGIKHHTVRSKRFNGMIDLAEIEEDERWENINIDVSNALYELKEEGAWAKLTDENRALIIQLVSGMCEHPLSELMFWNTGEVECKKCGYKTVPFWRTLPLTSCRYILIFYGLETQNLII